MLIIQERPPYQSSIVPGCIYQINPGVFVINGVPKHDVKHAAKVDKIRRIWRFPGYLVLEFQHPRKKNVCIQVAGFSTSDVYVNPKTKKTFFIFVDNAKSTLLIPKLLPPPKNNVTCNYAFDRKIIIDKYWKKSPSGSVVVNGVPPHDVRNPLWVWRSQKLVDSEGMLVHQFNHPLDRQKVQIPAYGTDEYFIQETSQVFILFVDNNGRTVLLYKGIIQQNEKIVTSNNIVTMKAYKKYREFGQKYGWGLLVVRGIPKYNLTAAKRVDETKTIIDVDGYLVTQFQHPITGQRIQIPANLGDEYVIPSKSKVYHIFVDVANRTLLILKDIDKKKSSLARDCVNGFNANVGLALVKYKKIAENQRLGSIVIVGLPKYDIPRAIYVNQTYTLIDTDSFLVVYFFHPTTGKGVQIPFDGGDEYVLPKESKVYIIFVDSAGKTLLVFKNRNVKKYAPEGKPNGTVVIGGVPSYNKSCVIFVNETDRLLHSHKVPVIQFVHPIAGQVMQIPENGGDEYLLPSTLQTFVIFVDAQNRTLLVFKNKYIPKEHRSVVDSGDKCANVFYAIQKYKQIARDKEWGSTAVHGVPKYNKSCVIFVNKTEKILDSDGCSVIQFVHPVTRQTIRIPGHGGDEYVVPLLFKTFVIFVDTRGRTLLVFKDKLPLRETPKSGGSCDNIIEALDTYRKTEREKRLGSMVIHGVPKYSTSNAMLIDETQKIVNSHRCVEIQFVHPMTEQIIRIPYYGGDEFVMPSVHKKFVIFVDHRNQTLLIFKDTYSPEERRPGYGHADTCKNVIDAMNKHQRMARETEWGSLVIHGVPKFTTRHVIFVNKVNKTLDSDGCLVVQFVHPITGQRIQVPYDGGDEFLMPLISKIFIIFVDNRSRTLLIFKSKLPSSEGKPENDMSDEDIKMTIKIYGDIGKEREWGSVVNHGVPAYNLSSAIFVDNTYRTRDSSGYLLITFVHPITEQTIQIPFYGGDRYTLPFTTKEYVIFVDAKGRALLILKPQKPTRTTEPSKHQNISPALMKYRELAEKNKWGWLVIHGLPKNDIPSAIFVNKTDKLVDPDGFLIIQFVHPITGQKIKIPYNGGDEYVLPKTSKVYVIFVDVKGRTLLVLKKENPLKGTKPPTDRDQSKLNVSAAIKKYREMAEKKKWGWMVIRGLPKNDIPSAMFVNKTEKRVDPDGFLIIQFVHPITGQKIQIPYNGGDEYVLPKTSKVYVIFVDVKGRTLLVLKKENPLKGTKPPTDRDQSKLNVSAAIKKYREMAEKKKWGWLVIHGRPKYDIPSAMFVNKTEKRVDPDGFLIIQFVHPITGQKIKIPYNGGDEYVLPKTSKVYVIFVDVKGRTLLIIKDNVQPFIQPKVPNKSESSMDYKKAHNISRPEKFGQVVINGLPKYDLSKAIFISDAQKLTEEDGLPVLAFIHPLTGREIHIPSQVGDEFIFPKTHELYVIYVDAQGRTLLIRKETDSGPQTISRHPENINFTTKQKVPTVLSQWLEISMEKGWGWLVVKGVPKYRLSQAIFVTKTKKLVDKRNVEWIRFKHPVTGQIIQAPLVGTDEYVLPSTSQVFLIFVDFQKRTLLIFKGKHKIVQNIGWGTLVVGGFPKYDLSSALYVMERKTLIDENGMLMLEFVHPVSKEKVRMPFVGCDEYVDPHKLRVFLIVVDSHSRTLLIFKRLAPGEPNYQNHEKLDILTKEYNAMAQENGWGYLVVKGFPKYDLLHALIVTRAQTKLTKKGIVMLKFLHPKSKQEIMVPFQGGDEYVDPLTLNVYIIFTDAQGKTLLIFKGTKPPSTFPPSSEPPLDPSVDNSDPPYNTSNAIYVAPTEWKVDQNGSPTIQFVHPITHEPIEITGDRDDEHVDPETGKVFITFIDRLGRTLLIPKDKSSSPAGSTRLPADQKNEYVRDGGSNLPQEFQRTQININKNINKNVFLPR
ncbi:uncharacterized protein [Venturia canescens]|uniref:uncharacterized protein n=1 Tax=Venturia canescens TaxID=32260 RepID=UPI001C9C1E49|nr:uncharacterized protein LOC122406229 [Venturia canescens]